MGISHLTEIWSIIMPMKNKKSRAAINTTYRTAMLPLGFKAPHILVSHAIAHLVLVLNLHTKTLEIVGYAENIFLFPYLYIYDTCKATLMSKRWYTTLGGSVQTTYTDTASLLQKVFIFPIVGWEVAG